MTVIFPALAETTYSSLARDELGSQEDQDRNETAREVEQETENPVSDSVMKPVAPVGKPSPATVVTAASTICNDNLKTQPLP